MERQFDEAAALGHDARDMVRRNRGRGENGGFYGMCSCGWTSTPRKRALIAASAGYFHVLEVLDAHEAGVTPETWSPAPATPRLRHETSQTFRAAAS